MIVRAAAEADHAACAVIFTAAWNYAFPHAPRIIDVATFLAETADELVFVAEIGGAVAGFAALFAPEAFLHHLYVAPACHGAAIGSALLTRALSETGGPLSLKCQRSNVGAVRFYAQRGFTEFASGEDPSPGSWAYLRAP
jgi:ribosomal protein S18 acetylase RimI-like enzyme